MTVARQTDHLTRHRFTSAGMAAARPAADGVEVSASPASPLAVLGSGSLAAYWRFHQAVANAQLAAWLPAPRKLLIDISGHGGGAGQVATAGHAVVRVVPVPPAYAVPGQDLATGGAPFAAGRGRPARAPGLMRVVMAEPGSLAFLADECADGVIAENGAFSRHLMTEDLAAEIARVLRPGGALLASVDSLVLGMAILAEQRHWAHLVDLPHSEVVLIPWPDGTITRCFGAGQLREVLTEAGLEVSWIRPRTVLSPSMVDHVLRRDPGAMARLVKAELRAWRDGPVSAGPEESFGIRLLAAARKRAAGRLGPPGG